MIKSLKILPKHLKPIYLMLTFIKPGGKRFDKGNLQPVPADIGKALGLKPEYQRNKKAKKMMETPFPKSI